MNDIRLIEGSSVNPSKSSILCAAGLLVALLLSVFSYSTKGAAVEGSVRVMKKKGAPIELSVNGASMEIQAGDGILD